MELSDRQKIEAYETVLRGVAGGGIVDIEETVKLLIESGAASTPEKAGWKISDVIERYVGEYGSLPKDIYGETVEFLCGEMQDTLSEFTGGDVEFDNYYNFSLDTHIELTSESAELIEEAVRKRIAADPDYDFMEDESLPAPATYLVSISGNCPDVCVRKADAAPAQRA